MLDTVTLDTFSPLVGETFQLHAANTAPIALVLVEAKGTVSDNDPRRTRGPFSLIFRGPANVVFAQGMYGLEREEIKLLDLFLVPVTPDAEGPRLQAVFT